MRGSRLGIAIVVLMAVLVLGSTMLTSAYAYRPIQTLWGQFFLMANRLLFWGNFLDFQLSQLDTSQPISPSIMNQLHRIRDNSEAIDNKLTPFIGEPDKPNTIVGMAAIGTQNVIDSNGFELTAFQDVDFIKVKHCENISCSTSTTNSVLEVPSVSRVSFALGSDGLPIVVVNWGESPFFKIVHCGALDCSAGNTVSGLLKGFAPDIAIGSDGLPLVSFERGDPTTDPFAFEVAVMHCGDSACISGNSNRTVATANQWNAEYNSPNFNTAIEKGSDNHAIVAIYSLDLDTNGAPIGSELDVLHCGDLDCQSAAGDTIHKVVENAGVDPSIAIDTDGLPVITFDSKVLKCGTLTC